MMNQLFVWICDQRAFKNWKICSTFPLNSNAKMQKCKNKNKNKNKSCRIIILHWNFDNSNRKSKTKFRKDFWNLVYIQPKIFVSIQNYQYSKKILQNNQLWEGSKSKDKSCIQDAIVLEKFEKQWNAGVDVWCLMFWIRPNDATSSIRWLIIYKKYSECRWWW
jgi:hypothetical protein